VIRTDIQPRSHLDYVPGQVIVRVAEPAVRPHVAMVAAGHFTAASARELPEVVEEPLDYLRRNAGLKDVRPVFSTKRDTVADVSVSPTTRRKLAVLSSVADSEAEELAGINVLVLDRKKLTPEVVRHVSRSKAIELIEPVPARWLAGQPVDAHQNLQWGLRAIEWFQSSIPDAREIRVGVMDTGIDVRHPDLKDVEMDYDHGGLSGDDMVGHGTHVAGIITANANNAVGISGVASCKLSVWKIFPDEPIEGEFYVDHERYWQALRQAELSGVRVVNLSIGGTIPEQVESLLFRRLQRKGITVVAAMGNEYHEGNPTSYPAAYGDVISVGSIAETRRRSTFSNTGRHIDLVAPGSNVLSTVPMRRSPYRAETAYAAWSGTSMATPHVAGAAALLATRFPEKSGTEIREQLRDTALKIPAMKDRSWTREYGSGLLSVTNALR
jgi:subtilisin family serine protease